MKHSDTISTPHRGGSMNVMEISAFATPLRSAKRPTPKPGPSDVRIGIRAAGVNPVDWKFLDGTIGLLEGQAFPVVPGFEMSGVVLEVGAAVERFAVGDRVFAYHFGIGSNGAYAEQVVLPADIVQPIPEGVDFASAAAIPLAAQTAWRALDAIAASAGTTVLILGASGGVGSFAVQMARHRGSHIIATASAANHDYVRELGAHEVINYRAGDVVEAVLSAHAGGVDGVVACVADPMRAAALDAVRDGGALASLWGGPLEAPRGITVHSIYNAVDGALLARIAELMAAGALSVSLQARYPLAHAAKALAASRAGHVRGKLVLTMDEPAGANGSR